MSPGLARCLPATYSNVLVRPGCNSHPRSFP